jgi:hypothetical protein
MTYVQLDPEEHREVRVQHSDGVWYPGYLEAYRQVEGVWEGYVRYTMPSETRLAWFEEGRIRGGRRGPGMTAYWEVKRPFGLRHIVVDPDNPAVAPWPVKNRVTLCGRKVGFGMRIAGPSLWRRMRRAPKSGSRVRRISAPRRRCNRCGEILFTGGFRKS